MTAARFDLETGGFGLHRIPVPRPGHGEVLIKVHAAGVCLSDVHTIDGTLPKPVPRDPDRTVVTLGHEVAGSIAAIGPGVPPVWSAGDRVCLTAGDRCDTCPNCLYDTGFCLMPQVRGGAYDGGWAEYVVTRHQSLVPLPDTLPFEQAAIIPDAVSTPYAGLLRHGGLRVGDGIGLWGVGGLGVHAVQIARLAGATPIIAIDPLPAARQRALDAGADLALDPTDDDFRGQVREATGGLGLDVAVDLVGHPTVRDSAAELLAPHGRMVLIGMTADPVIIPHGDRFNALQHQVHGAWGSEPQDLHRLVKLAAAGRLDLSGSVSAVLPLSRVEEAVARLHNKEGNPVRLVLVP
ncbi:MULTISPECIES: zinc-binding dehydrogenase [unclassified Streptomyces]|uniref:zinc-binding dehydrogenase n=2 Tax=unclassified Streptomyces TaxID=2593676 RepID=UPI000477555D|nr:MULTISPECIES: zinc-binding dehydrogenase [unclassified Streptomyces]MYT27543.1 zinc-binding dehydrogenase [Streptomyces sp. SID8354]